MAHGQECERGWFAAGAASLESGSPSTLVLNRTSIGRTLVVGANDSKGNDESFGPTVTDLCLSMFDRAKFRRTRGTVKPQRLPDHEVTCRR